MDEPYPFIDEDGFPDLTHPDEKPNPAEYGQPEINEVIATFKEVFGTTKATRYDRFAAKRLITKHGVANVKLVITALAAKGSAKYSPTVNSVSQLEDKWVSIVKYLHADTPKELDI